MLTRAFCLSLFATSLIAQTPPAVLPAVQVNSSRVANQVPSGVMAMPVSALRYEPRVDVQSRNLAEGQADVALRGGIFENTGFRVGAVSLYDPQTGHYLPEIPIAPAMVTPPTVLVGAENSLRGFNAGVGTIASGWRTITERGEASVAVGNHGFNQQGFYDGRVFGQRLGGRTVAADIEWARSESDGSRPFGEHDFDRIGGRVQLQGERGQSDFFAGYQAKFFGWPNLYTPFGFNETENIQTVLLAANHRETYGEGSWWQAGTFYRRNKDDYEFNRAVPGAANPFLHTTRVWGAAGEGRHVAAAGWAVAYHAAWMRDDLVSTALTAGRFNSREYLRLGAVPELGRDLAAGRVTVRAGVAFDDTDRDDAQFSPILSAELRPTGGGPLARTYFEYAETSQVPTYTALNSAATSGLFRGNPNLGRETMRNLELGAEWSVADWTIEAAIFRRWDDELVDWTYRQGVVARTANPVDLEVSGVEVVAVRRGESFDVVLGYAWLDKDFDYGSALVDASFYALNFARHRITAALTWRVGAGWEIRADNELRWQERNSLRTVGGDEAVLTSVGVYHRPPRWPDLELALQVDNLWDEDFQEVPAVPAGRRQLSGGATWRW